VVWKDDTDLDGDSDVDDIELKVAPLADPTAMTVLSDHYRGLVFAEDGLIGWLSTEPAIAVNDGATT
jgi:hypothetical protein